jgi:hypothetical protein
MLSPTKVAPPLTVEGMFCFDWAAFADVLPLRQRRPGLYWPEWLFTCEDIVDVGQR